MQYAADLPDGQWALVEPLVARGPGSCGLHEVVNVPLSKRRTGGQRRTLRSSVQVMADRVSHTLSVYRTWLRASGRLVLDALAKCANAFASRPQTWACP